MTILITGGTVVSADRARSPADVLVDGETIAAVLAPGARAGATAARRHGHRRDRQVRDPRRHRRAHPHGAAVRRHRSPRDTFETGTRAAAWGGTTTIIDFAVQRTGEVVQDGLAAWHAKADGNCAIDYGFHMIIGGVDDDVAQGDGPAGRPTRASPASSCSWRTRASSTPTTARSCGRCRRRASNGAHDHDARRERHRHRRARRAGAGPRRDRPELPRHHPAAGSWRRRPPTGRSCWPSVAGRAALHRAPVGASRRSSRSPRPATPARTCSPRPARSTCTCRWRTSSARPASRAPSGSARRRCARKHEGHQRRHVAGPAHQRPADGVHRPLPVLHEGPEGAGHRRLLQDPQRHRRRRAPRWTCSTRASSTGELTLERWVETDSHHAGPDVRPVPARRA